MPWQGNKERLAAEDGFTIVESLVAAVVLVVGLFGVMLMLDTANKTTGTTLTRDRATALARDLLERSRPIAFTMTDAAAFPAALRAAAPDGASAVSGGTFVVTRNGVPFTVQATSCKVDDDLDGTGVHDASFCDFNDAPPTATLPPGTPTGTAVKLKLLGIPIAVPLAGDLIDSTVCGLLGANPIGAVPLLDGLLGRGAAVDGVLKLVGGGADVVLCPGGNGQPSAALDRDAADFAKVTVRVSWTRDGQAAGVTQSAMVPNPGGA